MAHLRLHSQKIGLIESGGGMELGAAVRVSVENAVGLYSRFVYTFDTAGPYYIGINEYGNNGESGAYVLPTDPCLEPPPNETCDGAIDL
ncbi:MAG: hypothetical protein ABIF77_04820 [bacterium]